MNGRPDWDAYFLHMASVAARRGTCKRRQVGAVIVDAFGHVAATGYNGRPSGFEHCNGAEILTPPPVPPFPTAPDTVTYPHACEGADAPSGEGLDKCEAIHAEQNALIQCRNIQEAHALYVTVSPCIHCVRMLMNTPILRIVFWGESPHSGARELWESAGRFWIRQGRRKRDFLAQ